MKIANRFFLIIPICAGIIICFNSFIMQQDFKSEQKKSARVAKSYKEKEAFLKKLLNEKNLTPFQIDLFIRIFKQEKTVEVWAKNKRDKVFTHLIDYEICSSSGNLGPKREMGDNQTPEGFYYIDRFNPTSNFYLSLGVNYPNKSDKILGNKAGLGGDIFIHGNCVTIGCVPITDDKIKELYILALEAKASGQNEIPVHFFPCHLDKQGFENLCGKFPEDKNLQSFWKSLVPVYEHFEKNKNLPKISVLKDGSYSI